MITHRIAIALCTLALACSGTTSDVSDSGTDGHDGGSPDMGTDHPDVGTGQHDREIDAPRDVSKDSPTDHGHDRTMSDSHVGDETVPDTGGDVVEAGPGSPCRTANDCGGSYPGYIGCLQFTLPPVCGGTCTGAPYTDQCMTDTDCTEAGAGLVCSNFCECAFTGGYYPFGPWCIPGCTSDAQCGPGETCSPTHHCAPTPCVLPTDCGPNFTCTSSSVCGPAPCTKDSDCSGGYFCTVAGFDVGSPTPRYCAPHLGVCEPAGA